MRRGETKPAPQVAAPAMMETPVMVGLAVAVVSTVGLFLFFMKPNRTKFLNKQRQQLLLGERINLSHDTVRFRFLLPKAAPVLGLPVGKHFKVFAPNPKGKVDGEWNGKVDPESSATEIERKYTPTTSDATIGYVDLVIKVYEGGKIDRFPDGGKMSQYMNTLKVGDSLTLSGPWGMNEYLGKGKFKIGKRELSCKKLGMMAGGTGITPMLQVVTAVLSDPTDETQVSLLYANQTEDDILVRDMLDGLAAAHPGRFKLWYTIDRPKEGWAFSTGFITADMIQAHLPAPADDVVVLMCGPPPMVKFACQENLDKLGHKKEALVAF